MRIQLPARSIGRQQHLEVPVGVHLEFVDQFVGRRHDAVHRLQPDVARGAAIAEQPVTLPAAQRGAGVDAVRALHSPGHDVVGAGGCDAQDRIGVEPQHLVDTRGEQHEQVPHARREIDPISARRVGFHDLRGFAQPVQQIRPRRRPGRASSDRRRAAPLRRSRTAATPSDFRVAHMFPRFLVLSENNVFT